MRKFQAIWALALGLMAAGCTSMTSAEDGQIAVSDPFENVNRFFFDLNQRLDRNAARPAATAYRETVPGSVRGGLHNLLDNLGGPVTVANDLLQVRLESAGIAAGRFLVTYPLLDEGQGGPRRELRWGRIGWATCWRLWCCCSTTGTSSSSMRCG